MTRAHISLPLQYCGYYCISQEEQEHISKSMWASNNSKESDNGMQKTGTTL